MLLLLSYPVGRIPMNDLAAIIHGTTVATNCVLERKGARCGLITTRGGPIARAASPLTLLDRLDTGTDDFGHVLAQVSASGMPVSAAPWQVGWPPRNMPVPTKTISVAEVGRSAYPNASEASATWGTVCRTGGLRHHDQFEPPPKSAAQIPTASWCQHAFDWAPLPEGTPIHARAQKILILGFKPGPR